MIKSADLVRSLNRNYLINIHLVGSDFYFNTDKYELVISDSLEKEGFVDVALWDINAGRFVVCCSVDNFIDAYKRLSGFLETVKPRQLNIFGGFDVL